MTFLINDALSLQAIDSLCSKRIDLLNQRPNLSCFAEEVISNPLYVDSISMLIMVDLTLLYWLR